MRKIYFVAGFIACLVLTQSGKPAKSCDEPKPSNIIYYDVTGRMITDTTKMHEGVYIRTENNEMTTKIIRK